MQLWMNDVSDGCLAAGEGTAENLSNRPFPSSPPPPFQSEAKCEVFVMKISFHSY